VAATRVSPARVSAGIPIRMNLSYSWNFFSRLIETTRRTFSRRRL
jgi:hypothetical protein